MDRAKIDSIPMPTRIHAVGVLVLCGGCFGNTSTVFPEGLEPLEDNLVPARDTIGIDFVDGDNGSYAWVHGRAWVAAAPADAWMATKDADVMAAVCSTDSHAIAPDVEEGYELSFQISYQVDELITVAWDELWRYGTIEGVPEDPIFGMVRYQKVYGSELISTLEGSIQIHATDDPGITEIELIEHLAAAGGTLSDMRASMQYRFDSLAAVATGGTPPPCP